MVYRYELYDESGEAKKREKSATYQRACTWKINGKKQQKYKKYKNSNKSKNNNSNNNNTRLTRQETKEQESTIFLIFTRNEWVSKVNSFFFLLFQQTGKYCKHYVKAKRCQQQKAQRRKKKKGKGENTKYIFIRWPRKKNKRTKEREIKGERQLDKSINGKR